MANQLDLEEQEKLDQIKHFLKQYGNFLLAFVLLISILLAGWNGYEYWQKSQALQAGEMYDELERVVRAKDVEKIERVFSDMKERYPSTTYTKQAGFLAAKNMFEANKQDSAKSILNWLYDRSKNEEISDLLRLRISTLLFQEKLYPEALRVLEAVKDPEFLYLAEDKRGDIYMAQSKLTEAKSAYEKAYSGMDEKLDFRKIVEFKLNALGVNPATVSNDSKITFSENTK
jgi:predicted negative regulator of RcsB-dependent stress response